MSELDPPPAASHRYRPPRARIVLACTVCMRPYVQHRYRALTSKFCSKACWSMRAPRPACRHCGQVFARRTFRKTYCSRSSRQKGMVGPDSTRWIDGHTLHRERNRFRAEQKRWRRAVLDRDGHSCQDCGSTERLAAHHLMSWKAAPDLRFTVSNGVTLCAGCHDVRHGRRHGRRHHDKQKSQH
jgi:5-methylcytosine-specific restriction endonuclease McrA